MAVRATGLTVTANGAAGKKLLRNVSFAAEERAITLVVGRTGSGKSTLLRALAGLIRPERGDVTYGGKPLWNGKRPDRALLLETALAFQFPEHQLFASTVQGEFEYSLRPYRLPKAERMRRAASALEDQRLPASMLTHSPFLLSGGQKRRVALATIMSARTPWLLLDEPSAGLDAASLSRLTTELAQWKRRCGIVLATHDLDAFLPIADRVLILRGGEVAADVTPEQLAADPRPLVESGVGLTEAMRTAEALRRAGVPVPPGAFSPERAAEAIAAAAAKLPFAGVPDAAAELPQMRSAEPAVLAVPSDAPGDEPGRGCLYRLDAKRKWLTYTLASLGIVLQTGWIGLMAALLFVLGCMSALTADDRRKLLRLARPLVWFMAFAVAFSGVRFGASIGFSFETALETFRRLFAFFEITAAGLVFTLSTSTADMKTGLERGLRPLKRIGLPVEALALSASLVLRFIPLILDEADRFAGIARSRGKRGTKPGQVHPLDLPVFAIPLLTALFQAVEELIVAMELKGVMQPRSGGKHPAELGSPRLAANPRREKQALWAGLGLFVLLLVIRLLEEVPL